MPLIMEKSRSGIRSFSRRWRSACHPLEPFFHIGFLQKVNQVNQCILANTHQRFRDFWHVGNFHSIRGAKHTYIFLLNQWHLEILLKPIVQQSEVKDRLITSLGNVISLATSWEKEILLFRTIVHKGSAKEAAIKADISHWQHAVRLCLCWQAPLPPLCVMLILPHIAEKAQQLARSKGKSVQAETAWSSFSCRISFQDDGVWPSESRSLGMTPHKATALTLGKLRLLYLPSLINLGGTISCSAKSKMLKPE